MGGLPGVSGRTACARRPGKLYGCAVVPRHCVRQLHLPGSNLKRIEDPRALLMSAPLTRLLLRLRDHAPLPEAGPDAELLGGLEEEVRGLPEAYGLPVVLCGLEGLAQEEADQRLGWTAGSVRGRLERGRKRLHASLARRGLTLSAALAAVQVTRAETVSG